MAEVQDKSPQQVHQELAKAANVGPSDPVPAMAWAIRGMTGALNLLEGMVKEGNNVPDWWKEYLKNEWMRFTCIVDDLGLKPEYHQ